jgi:putative oxidoreductase
MKEENTMNQQERITWSLLFLRVTVFVVMLFWTLDKFVQPEHTSKVFAGFYGLSGLGETAFYLLGAAELLLILAFVTGSWKRISYGLVLLLHGISTLSSYRQYLDPFSNLMFFAAWPMLGACAALYLLRDLDTRWTTSLGKTTLTRFTGRASDA